MRGLVSGVTREPITLIRRTSAGSASYRRAVVTKLPAQEVDGLLVERQLAAVGHELAYRGARWLTGTVGLFLTMLHDQ